VWCDTLPIQLMPGPNRTQASADVLQPTQCLPERSSTCDVQSTRLIGKARSTFHSCAFAGLHTTTQLFLSHTSTNRIRRGGWMRARRKKVRGYKPTLRQACLWPKPQAQYAFKNSMIHGILQFTLRIAFRCVLHRCESLDIRC
jgi:hypothetical protein